MTITIAEVIEQCAREVYPTDHDATHIEVMWCKRIAARIRALAAQYEGCIVADEKRVYCPRVTDDNGVLVPLYRARETKPCA